MNKCTCAEVRERNLCLERPTNGPPVLRCQGCLGVYDLSRISGDHCDDDMTVMVLTAARHACRALPEYAQPNQVRLFYGMQNSYGPSRFIDVQVTRGPGTLSYTVGVDTAAPGTRDKSGTFIHDRRGRAMVFELDPQRDLGVQIQEIIGRISRESVAKQVGFAPPPDPAPSQNHGTSEPTPAQRVEYPTDQLHSVLRYLAMPSNAHPAAQEVLLLAIQSIHTRLQTLATELRSREVQWTNNPTVASAPSPSSPVPHSSGR